MATEIFKHARKRGQSIVENAFLDDSNVTGMAKYLLIQFCSHREGTWTINMKDIIKRSKDGRDKHYKVVNELIHNNYIARIKVLEKGIHRKQIYIYGHKADVADMLQETIAEIEAEGIYTTRVEYGEPLPESQETDKEENKKPLPENTDTVKTDAEKSGAVDQYNRNNQSLENTNIEKTKEEKSNKNPSISHTDQYATDPSAQKEKLRKEYTAAIDKFVTEGEVPTSVLKVLSIHTDRLIDHGIHPYEVEIFYKSSDNSVSRVDFPQILTNVLTKTKGKIDSFHAVMKKAIANWSSDFTGTYKTVQDEEGELSTYNESLEEDMPHPPYKSSGKFPFYNWLEETD
ncbi:hypothetical protein [Aneurinibacillus tyrosinisolvens]|uniref:hypothetical protein n=1 Tax=Aneurinibacillus tyrosinisolvens TaxID=1443435 RepID=UPI00063FD1EC|nr:hypothetical protein [Aneurinibacillus tyrosinisolvens]